MVFLTEHYRPVREMDQMFTVVSGINFVKGPIHDKVWIESRYVEKYGSLAMNKIVINELDIKELPDIINDYVYYNNIQQPCELSIYALCVRNISSMNVVVRNIIEHNLTELQE
jgi:hypothetical protein